MLLKTSVLLVPMSAQKNRADYNFWQSQCDATEFSSKTPHRWDQAVQCKWQPPIWLMANFFLSQNWIMTKIEADVRPVHWAAFVITSIANERKRTSYTANEARYSKYKRIQESGEKHNLLHSSNYRLKVSSFVLCESRLRTGEMSNFPLNLRTTSKFNRYLSWFFWPYSIVGAQEKASQTFKWK